MCTISGHEDLVKDELFKFMRKFLPNAQLSQIDEIVLSYVVSILEDLGNEENPEDTFDLDAFIEMLSAYFPQFSLIDPPTVCTWLFELSTRLSKIKTSTAVAETTKDKESPKEITMMVEQITERQSETSDVSSDSGDEVPSQEEQEYIDAQLTLLQEMFPTACALEVRHCLAIAGGDTQQAAQLVLHRQEAGQSLTATSVQQSNTGRLKAKVDDQELKERIIARYSYIDKDESKREHRPVAPKSEPKKLIRYRDNKIVSMKGERFSEVKDETEEKESKKNLASGNKAPTSTRTISRTN